eukprot:2408231-Karenia_brevis.AAC.1
MWDSTNLKTNIKGHCGESQSSRKIGAKLNGVVRGDSSHSWSGWNKHTWQSGDSGWKAEKKYGCMEFAMGVETAAALSMQ